MPIQHSRERVSCAGLQSQAGANPVRLRLATFDWNCPQHITPRFTEARRLREAVRPMRERLAAAGNRKCRAASEARRSEGRLMMEPERPPLPPFTTVEAAVEKVRLAEDGVEQPRPEARSPCLHAR